MNRWIGSWLSGPGSAGETNDTDTVTRSDQQRYRGERLGLPAEGPGAVASRGRRLGGFLVDCVIGSLIAALFVHPQFMDQTSMQTLNYWGALVWFLINVVAVGFFGFTPGMALFGIRAARVDGVTMVGPVRAIIRTVLIAVIVPAVIWDMDGRGWHDKAARTIVLNTR
ncbi:MAG TPA: RDD family protein [Pseudonocardiaceae bacterium]